MAFLTLCLLVFNTHSVFTLRHVQPVAQKVWSERCNRNAIALNDCNWCTCDAKMEYTCNARACNEVDMFGHFNDAIKEMDVGIEGRGVWRSDTTACEAGVHYRKGDLLCVCTDDGAWPNPVCRDVFQILHAVETTEYDRPEKNQSCSATKLHLYGCNVCFCPSSGFIDPQLCTKRNCFNENVVRSGPREGDHFEEVYANCTPTLRYRLGCQTCICLRNNRLLCDNCTMDETNNKEIKKKSLCSGQTPDVIFQRDCNFCFCDKKDTIYCTAKKCLPNNAVPMPKIKYELVASVPDDYNCVPATMYKKDCNLCHCFMVNGIKYFGCTMKSCKKPLNGTFPLDCVEKTTYLVDCLICHCLRESGVRREHCTIDPTCNADSKSLQPLSSMHGYCEPMHYYQNDCNKCRCLEDGHTLACTSNICNNAKLETTTTKSKPVMKTRNSQRTLEPMTMEFIPFIEKDNDCPKGRTYKIDCNLCYCMQNGNTICTTKPCT